MEAPVFLYFPARIVGELDAEWSRVKETMKVESATPRDTQAIVSIFAANQDDPGLFQESEAEVRRNLKDFLVARDAAGRAVACAGIHRDSAELAEIFGVAVLPEFQGQGIGAALMGECKERAAASQLTHLWLATVKPEYFRRFRFVLYPGGACLRWCTCGSYGRFSGSRYNVGCPLSVGGTPLCSAVWQAGSRLDETAKSCLSCRG